MRAWRRVDGFTLAELLVTLAVLGLVLAGTLTILQNGVRAYGWGARRVEAQQSVRLALERMVKELRDAGYDPKSAGIAPITVAAPDRVTFQQDLNKNGIVDSTRERITFLLRPGESILRRDAGGGAQPIIEHVRRFRLTYFDRDGVPTTDPAGVGSIHILLEAGRSGPTSLMETSVTLRNARMRSVPAE
jgi:type IV pilus assembly protein PilW